MYPKMKALDVNAPSKLFSSSIIFLKLIEKFSLAQSALQLKSNFDILSFYKQRSNIFSET